jgi:hypothetical protein
MFSSFENSIPGLPVMVPEGRHTFEDLAAFFLYFIAGLAET